MQALDPAALLSSAPWSHSCIMSRLGAGSLLGKEAPFPFHTAVTQVRNPMVGKCNASQPPIPPLGPLALQKPDRLWGLCFVVPPEGVRAPRQRFQVLAECPVGNARLARRSGPSAGRRLRCPSQAGGEARETQADRLVPLHSLPQERSLQALQRLQQVRVRFRPPLQVAQQLRGREELQVRARHGPQGCLRMHGSECESGILSLHMRWGRSGCLVDLCAGAHYCVGLRVMHLMAAAWGC